MKQLVSIIVPVYNTEQTLLEKCINSLISQTYKNLEIIIVDDGSNDDTAHLCDEISLSDSRIVVIHKQNGGLSSARNAGLEIVKGDFISFVDSDDFIEIDSIEKLLYARQTSGCQIVCMRSVIFDQDGKILYHFGNDTCRITGIDYIEYLRGVCEKKLSESVCDKLFSSSLLKTRRFETGRLNEDFLFLSKMLMIEHPNIALLDFAGYHYYKHSGSITADHRNFTSLKDAIKNSCILAEFAKDNEPNTYYGFIYSALFQTRVLMTASTKDGDVSDSYQFCKDVITEYKSLVWKCNLKTVDKILLMGYYHAPRLTNIIYKVIKH